MERLKSILRKLQQSLTNNLHLKLLSLIISIIAWLIVTWTIEPDVTKSIKNVPIQVGMSESSTARKMGLGVIDGNDKAAMVYINGRRNIVGVIKSEDISVLASAYDILEAGTYELPIEASIKNKMYKDVTVEAIQPSVIKVRFDKIISKTIPVEVIYKGIVVPEGYILGAAMPSTESLIITGPEKDIEKIDKGVIVCDVNKEQTKSIKLSKKVILANNDGLEIDTTYVNVDYEEIHITIPVLKKKKLDVTVSFINQSTDFPLDELKYTIEPSKIELAGPEEDIDKKESINVGYIDMNRLNPDEQELMFKVPNGFVDIENIENVKIYFDMNNITSKNISKVDIRVPNTLVTHDIRVNSKHLNNIKIVGKKDIVQKLTSGDIVAEVQINDSDIVVGQMTVPIIISIPNKGLVWSVGEYKAVVTIKDKK